MADELQNQVATLNENEESLASGSALNRYEDLFKTADTPEDILANSFGGLKDHEERVRELREKYKITDSDAVAGNKKLAEEFTKFARESAIHAEAVRLAQIEIQKNAKKQRGSIRGRLGSVFSSERKDFAEEYAKKRKDVEVDPKFAKDKIEEKLKSELHDVQVVNAVSVDSLKASSEIGWVFMSGELNKKTAEIYNAGSLDDIFKLKQYLILTRLLRPDQLNLLKSDGEKIDPEKHREILMLLHYLKSSGFVEQFFHGAKFDSSVAVFDIATGEFANENFLKKTLLLSKKDEVSGDPELAKKLREAEDKLREVQTMQIDGVNGLAYKIWESRNEKYKVAVSKSPEDGIPDNIPDDLKERYRDLYNSTHDKAQIAKLDWEVAEEIKKRKVDDVDNELKKVNQEIEAWQKLNPEKVQYSGLDARELLVAGLTKEFEGDPPRMRKEVAERAANLNLNMVDSALRDQDAALRRVEELEQIKDVKDPSRKPAIGRAALYSGIAGSALLIGSGGLLAPVVGAGVMGRLGYLHGNEKAEEEKHLREVRGAKMIDALSKQFNLTPSKKISLASNYQNLKNLTDDQLVKLHGVTKKALEENVLNAADITSFSRLARDSRRWLAQRNGVEKTESMIADASDANTQAYEEIVAGTKAKEKEEGKEGSIFSKLAFWRKKKKEGEAGHAKEGEHGEHKERPKTFWKRLWHDANPKVFLSDARGIIGHAIDNNLKPAAKGHGGDH